MPKPVRELLRLVHVEQVDLSQVKRVDFEIINYLKESHPDLYRNLRRAARSKHKQATGAPTFPGDDSTEQQARSEEHTSELQSRFDLVCCPLLEKKRSNLLSSSPKPQ